MTNSVILIGRPVKDMELRYLANAKNTAVGRFTLAVDRQLSREKRQELEQNNQPTADFINIKLWGKMAESLSPYIMKGKMLAVEGRIETGSYEKDGRRVYTTEVVASNIQILEWPNKDQGNSANDVIMPNQEGFFEVNNEDIPF